MMREMMRAKIAYPTVTQTELYYEGSITIDELILEAAGILEGEKVDVLNVNNGERLYTYAIKGEKGSGVICLNGPAARKASVGDKIVVLTYASYAEEELADYTACYVTVDEQNAITNTVVR